MDTPKVSEQEAAEMSSSARIAAGPHPMDNFMDGVFSRLEKRYHKAGKSQLTISPKHSILPRKG
jgi:hypothetical protein